MSSPDNNKKVPAYEALAHDIKRSGIESVFGLMSNDTALFVTTLRDPQGPLLLDCKIYASVAAAVLLETVEHERRKS